MFPCAAIATETGYVFVGGEPSVSVNTSKKSVASHAKEVVSLCRERAVRFFEKEPYDCARVRSHGRHGRKKVKARHLPQ